MVIRVVTSCQENNRRLIRPCFSMRCFLDHLIIRPFQGQSGHLNQGGRFQYTFGTLQVRECFHERTLTSQNICHHSRIQPLANEGDSWPRLELAPNFRNHCLSRISSTDFQHFHWVCVHHTLKVFPRRIKLGLHK